MKKTKLTRKQLREKYADEICRELRYQLANDINDRVILKEHVSKWLSIAFKRTKYIRPNIPSTTLKVW